jgi:DNA-binding response OmpR family regulator
MKIYVIDDNKEITDMLQRYFSLKGHDCSVTNDGRLGLSTIRQTK